MYAPLRNTEFGIPNSEFGITGIPNSALHSALLRGLRSSAARRYLRTSFRDPGNYSTKKKIKKKNK